MNLDLTVIDLISDMHAKLRRVAEKRWESVSDIEFSHTEWFLLSKAFQGSITVSKAAEIMGISRQGMHKCAKNLEIRGYIKFLQGDNKRDKNITLTDIGIECCRQNSIEKKKIEDEISYNLGEENLIKLKSWLKLDWLET